MRIVILRRTDTDWKGMTYESYLAQESSINLPSRLINPDTLSLIYQWEEATGLSYFRYRAFLKDECMKRHRTLGVEVCGSVSELTDDDIVIPVDDDDLLFNHAIDVCRDAFRHKSTNVLTWARRTWVNGDIREEGLTHYIDTCNAAFRYSWLRAGWKGEDVERMLSKHQVAQLYIGRRMGIIPAVMNDLMKMHPGQNQTSYVALKGAGVMHVDLACSLYFLHSGSISYLTAKMKASGLDVVEHLRSLPLHPVWAAAHPQTREAV